MPKGLLMEQDPALNPVEAQEELVRRGVAALPNLLKHLDDRRKTKATITGMMGGISHRAAFDWNFRTATTRPAGLRPPDDFHEWTFHSPIAAPGNGVEDNPYSIAVGDLCFEAIGRIVNRDYEATGYRPSGIVIVNSPVLSAELCKAVRAEWTSTARSGRSADVGAVLS
jgi:hypothetical protein